MPKSVYVYEDPTTSSFTSSTAPTPFGIYDSDTQFISESLQVTKYVAKKLGHPVMQLEINSGSIWACFEEAVSDYSKEINTYNAKNWMWEHYGSTNKVTGSGWSNQGTASQTMGTGSIQPTKPHMGSAVYLSEQYGEAVNVGGDTTLHSGSFTLQDGKQVYDVITESNIPTAHTASNNRIEIQTIFNYGPAAVTKFYDPSAGSYDQRNMLDSFGMGNVSPAVSFMLRPLYSDITRTNMIETNDRIRKSAYSFELVDDKLRLFPIPTSGSSDDTIWFQYYLRNDRVSTSRLYTDSKVTDPSNIPYKFITYSEINSSGRQWIRRYTLALAKELLGIIRSKYANMPIPGGEVTMDGEALKAEGREEKATLVDELKEFLDSVSLSEGARKEQEIADAQQQVLNKAPLGIYLG